MEMHNQVWQKAEESIGHLSLSFLNVAKLLHVEVQVGLLPLIPLSLAASPKGSYVTSFKEPPLALYSNTSLL